MGKQILIEYEKKMKTAEIPEYDYEEFKKALMDIMGAYTQLEFSEITGIANAHISRVLNGHRTNQPTLKSVHKIAKAAKQPDQILKLFKATGYLQEGLAYLEELKKNEVVAETEQNDLSQRTSDYEKYHRNIQVLFNALLTDRGIKSRAPSGSVFSNHLYYELNCDLKEWHFFIADESYESRDAIYMMYGMIASYATFRTSKFSIITNHDTVYAGFTKILPHNLNANVSVILLDTGYGVKKECMLSSSTDPLPDELTEKLTLTNLFVPAENDYMIFTE